MANKKNAPKQDAKTNSLVRLRIADTWIVTMPESLVWMMFFKGMVYGLLFTLSPPLCMLVLFLRMMTKGDK